MRENHPESLSRHISIIADPRMDRTKDHSLHDILIIAVLAMLCGAENFVEFEYFGEAKESWLRTFLKLPKGIPSHDTFGRVFAMLVSTRATASTARPDAGAGWVSWKINPWKNGVGAADKKLARCLSGIAKAD
jgi:hypothetical protein